MRLLAVLLSLYILILTAYPCTDHTEDVVDGHQTELAVQEHHHDHHDGESDTCSPFCQCVCCQIHIEEPLVFNLHLTSLDFQEHTTNVSNCLALFPRDPASPPPKA